MLKVTWLVNDLKPENMALGSVLLCVGFVVLRFSLNTSIASTGQQGGSRKWIVRQKDFLLSFRCRGFLFHF